MPTPKKPRKRKPPRFQLIHHADGVRIAGERNLKKARERAFLLAFKTGWRINLYDIEGKDYYIGAEFPSPQLPDVFHLWAAGDCYYNPILN